MKFNSDHDEWVYSQSLDWDGASDAPTGSFAGVTIEDTADEEDALRHYGTRFLIIFESNEGFVTVIPFDDADKRDARLKELENAVRLWANGIGPEQAVAAIFGYRAAAVWVASPNEEAPPAVDEQAQRTIRNEVIQYITENADDLKIYIEAIGVDWGRVGHEFYLARNGHPAFTDHAGGPVVDALMESARAYGEQRLRMGDTEELVVA